MDLFRDNLNFLMLSNFLWLEEAKFIFLREKAFFPIKM